MYVALRVTTCFFFISKKVKNMGGAVGGSGGQYASMAHYATWGI